MGPHRVNIINTLQLIAAPSEQLEYQQHAPRINVATELVNQWFDDFSIRVMRNLMPNFRRASLKPWLSSTSSTTCGFRSFQTGFSRCMNRLSG